MTEQSIRDELTLIARDVHLYDGGANQALAGLEARRIADAILASPVILRIQAEALREAAEWKREHNLGNSVWGDYLQCLAEERYQAGGDDMITIWLNDRADRIEKGQTP